MKNKMVACDVVYCGFAKDKYVKPIDEGGGIKPELTLISFYKNKRYGLVARIKTTNNIFEGRNPKKLSKSAKKKEEERWSDIKTPYTKNWTRVSDEARRIEIAKNFIILEIMKEDWSQRESRIGRIDALYWDLYGEQPPWWKIPCMWTNYSMGEDIAVAVAIMKGTERDPSIRCIVTKKGKLKKFTVKGGIEKVRADRKKWIQHLIDNMIKVEEK